MALIKCPECGNSISDKAEKCPHCGLPAEYFLRQQEQAEINYNNLANILVSFDSDYSRLFSKNHYITHRDEKFLQETYGAYGAIKGFLAKGGSPEREKLIFEKTYKKQSKQLSEE